MALTIKDAKLIAKEVAQLLRSDVWFNESDGREVIGIEAATLKKMRNNPDYSKGWRYLGNGVDTNNRTIRRHIQWNKEYLNSLFKQVA